MSEKTNISRNIKNLYLDPNNYRFIDNKEYIKVDDDKLLEDRIQARTRKFIEGKNQTNIKDLLESFQANGFLDVDVIQVKEIGHNKYLVLEGNRRVTALKFLQEKYKNDGDIGDLDPAIFSKIPFEIHNKNDIAKHKVIMGLKHINGNKKWPTLNQAQLVNDIVSGYDNESEGERFAQSSLGISKAKVRRYIRVLKLIEYYKKSDYEDNFSTDMYSLFEEVIKKPIIKEWLGFNDYTYEVSNKMRLERFFTWISPSEKTEYNEELDEEEVVDIQDPIIMRSHEIRTLAEFINDENALKKLEETRDVSKALAVSAYVGKSKFTEALNSAKSDIHNAILFQEYLEDKDIESIEQLNENIQKLLPQKVNISLEKNQHISAIFTEGTREHFSEIEIVSYKHFRDFRMNGFKRVNIIAGFNNSGKTTLLESIYFLTIQNDISRFLDLIKLKNKFEDELSPIWLNQILNHKISLKAVYNGVQNSLKVQNKETEEEIDKISYVSTIEILSAVNKEENSSKIHLYSNKKPVLHFKNIKYLCFSMFKSPYFYNHNDLVNSYSDAVDKGMDKKIIEFLQKIDNSIQEILFIEKEGIKRFIVRSSKYESSRDITSFGEGLQRIFEISLAFASCKNGVLFLDELETAIHKSLLIDFTNFIQELAEEFNVQVFATSHSKECIDAFVKNDYEDNSELMAYFLENRDGELKYKYIDGNRFHNLVESMDLDIRGDKSE
ncbi:MAG TPA: hypothetical protein ENK66_05060 [Arcobacter sp.]|nr:hypothetical protein [Arcobacter sp.]